MTVTPLKIEKLASTALALLDREIVLPGLVTVSSGAEFVGALDDTVTIRVPARTMARSRALRPVDENARTIILSDLEEQAIHIILDEDLYNAVGIEDEVATLDIADFGSQVLLPQVRAVALAWENKIAGEITGATYIHEVEWDDARPFDSMVDARKLLADSFVPTDGRRMVVGSGMEAALLKSDQLIRYDSSGDASALKTATLGRIAGVDVVVSQAIPEDEGYLFHKSAFSAAWRAPVVPRGASFGKSVSATGGIALTWLCDYDAMQSRDRSIVHVYTGTNHTVDPADENADNDLVAAGGFLRAVKFTRDAS